MVPDVAMVADAIPIVCGMNIGGCDCTGLPTFCEGGTSAAAPLWAGFLALVNQGREGSGSSASKNAVGFVNQKLYQLAGASTASYATNFNDIQDNSNNNFFDNGQPTESGSVPVIGAAPPAIALPYNQEQNAFCAPTANTLLPGAATVGTSEAAGLYHAVSGYDLATGLGTPTCGLFFSLQPPCVNGSPPSCHCASNTDCMASQECSAVGTCVTAPRILDVQPVNMTLLVTQDNIAFAQSDTFNIDFDITCDPNGTGSVTYSYCSPSVGGTNDEVDFNVQCAEDAQGGIEGSYSVALSEGCGSSAFLYVGTPINNFSLPPASSSQTTPSAQTPSSALAGMCYITGNEKGLLGTNNNACGANNLQGTLQFTSEP
jgi:hypothetical protein